MASLSKDCDTSFMNAVSQRPQNNARISLNENVALYIAIKIELPHTDLIGSATIQAKEI
jgi:hypothetical protein